MNCIGTYDGTIFYNPANKFCIISVKTADQSVPAEARSNRRYKDHLIRFTAVGYEIPRTDAVELELDGDSQFGEYQCTQRNWECKHTVNISIAKEQATSPKNTNRNIKAHADQNHRNNKFRHYFLQRPRNRINDFQGVNQVCKQSH